MKSLWIGFLVWFRLLSSGTSYYLTSSRLRSSFSLLKRSASTGGNILSHYEEFQVSTLKGIHLTDITPQVHHIVKEHKLENGQICLISKHTTTSIIINEMESRLVDDTRQFLLKLAPEQYPYLHNDLHLRKGPPGWPGGDEAWRAQEPINAHSHLLNILLGSSVTIPVANYELQLGRWQSIILVELDGPKERTVGIQLFGTKEDQNEGVWDIDKYDSALE